MALTDRHVLREWAAGFALTLGVILGLLVLQNMYDTLPDLLETRASVAEIVRYYALALPGYVPTILPIAFLVSILFSLGALHRNNEITALRTAGLSLWRISRPLWLAGALLSGFLFYLTAMVVPQTVERSRAFLENLEYEAREAEVAAREIGVVHNLGFDNRKANRLWFMNRFSERAWLGMGVNVHTRNEAGMEISRISAEEAFYDDTRGFWVFVNGRELVVDPETGDPLRVIPFERRKMREFGVDPQLMLALHKEPKELSLFELRDIIDTLSPGENPAVHAYEVRYYSLLAAPFSCLVVVGLAVPFAVSGVRTNPMVGVSKCMGLFLAFYVLITLATVLGERRLIPAWFAAWLPNLAMLALAGGLFRRAR